MQDDVCLLQAALVGWAKEMVLVMVVEVVGLVEVVVELREREETRDVPVIVVLTFLTGHYIWK